MVIFVSTVGALCAWVILWAFGIKGVQGIAIVLVVVGIAVGLQHILSALPGRRE
jgi:hypothetical protein